MHHLFHRVVVGRVDQTAVEATVGYVVVVLGGFLGVEVVDVETRILVVDVEEFVEQLVGLHKGDGVVGGHTAGRTIDALRRVDHSVPVLVVHQVLHARDGQFVGAAAEGVGRECGKEEDGADRGRQTAHSGCRTLAADGEAHQGGHDAYEQGHCRQQEREARLSLEEEVEPQPDEVGQHGGGE